MARNRLGLRSVCILIYLVAHDGSNCNSNRRDNTLNVPGKETERGRESGVVGGN